MWRHLLNQLAIGDIAFWWNKAFPKFGDIALCRKSVPENRGHSFLLEAVSPKFGYIAFNRKTVPDFRGDQPTRYCNFHTLYSSLYIMYTTALQRRCTCSKKFGQCKSNRYPNKKTNKQKKTTKTTATCQKISNTSHRKYCTTLWCDVTKCRIGPTLRRRRTQLNSTSIYGRRC